MRHREGSRCVGALGPPSALLRVAFQLSPERTGTFLGGQRTFPGE
jgi:hypothetical protein